MRRRTKLGVGSLVATGALALAMVPILGASGTARVLPQAPVNDAGLAVQADRAYINSAVRYVTAVVNVWGYEAWLRAEKARQDAARAPRRSSGGGGSGGGSCDRPVNYGDGDGSYSIPSNVVARESGGNYGSCNESSGACGAYQALPSTWDGYAGYGSACDAPPAVQDQWAQEAYTASGCDPWGGC